MLLLSVALANAAHVLIAALAHVLAPRRQRDVAVHVEILQMTLLKQSKMSKIKLKRPNKIKKQLKKLQKLLMI